MSNKTIKTQKQIIREYAEALIFAILIAFFIRSIIIEPYKIPSRSMVPTLLVGDHIFVNKMSYGWRVPGTKFWLTKWGEPKRGEVIVFIYPKDESLDFIKRVVGLPGDHVQYKAGQLLVNDQEVSEEEIRVLGIDPHSQRDLLIPSAQASTIPNSFQPLPYSKGFEDYVIKLENLLGVQHLIQRSITDPNEDEFDLIVPEKHFFVMGDNRDQSSDSRFWGFVPRENLKGHALFIWLSLDNEHWGIRLRRFGKKII